VGHNANFILNVPVNKEGLICKEDSINLVTYHEIIQHQLATDILSSMNPAVTEERRNHEATALTDDDYDSYWATNDSTLTASIEFSFPTQKVNRMMLQEYIPLGQRVKKFSVEYKSGAEWLPIHLNEETTTIGYKRLLRFPTVETEGLRVNILDSRACPCLNHIGAYYGGEGSDIVFEDKGEDFHSVEFTLTEEKGCLVLDLGQAHAVNVLHYLPPNDGKGIITHYELYAGNTPETAKQLITKGEFSNIQNNPILQTLRFAPTLAKVLVLKATATVNQGEAPKAERMGVEVFY
jgi:alpha-L-fucosidase